MSIAPGSERNQAGLVGRGHFLSSLDAALARAHEALFARHPLASLVVVIALYALVILSFGSRLEISSNYFVLAPLMAAALSYRLPGGVAAGVLALPCNLALFSLIGHPEFSPASKLIAELSGIFVGAALGYLADYFKKLDDEFRLRAKTEESLRRALEEKEFLLREVHHRVRNNLTVIKSLIQLQRSRAGDKAAVEAMDGLLARVFAIAQAHESLLEPEESPAIDLGAYIASLLASIAKGGPLGISASPELLARWPEVPIVATPEFAEPIGLFLNEAVQNALRHAWDPPDRPVLSVSLARGDEGCALAVEDNGRGLPTPVEERLGFLMMRALASQVDGVAVFGPGAEGRGTRVTLRFSLPPYSASMKG